MLTTSDGPPTYGSLRMLVGWSLKESGLSVIRSNSRTIVISAVGILGLTAWVYLEGGTGLSDRASSSSSRGWAIKPPRRHTEHVIALYKQLSNDGIDSSHGTAPGERHTNWTCSCETSVRVTFVFETAAATTQERSPSVNQDRK